MFNRDLESILISYMAGGMLDSTTARVGAGRHLDVAFGGNHLFDRPQPSDLDAALGVVNYALAVALLDGWER